MNEVKFITEEEDGAEGVGDECAISFGVGGVCKGE